MKRKPLIAAALALTFLLTLTACGKTQHTDQTQQPDAATEQTGETESTVPPTAEETPTEEDVTKNTDDDAWKTDFEQSLFDNYGVTPDHYEDLGHGIYQVYVEINGNVVPFVTVDSSTGDYHG